MGLYYRVEHIRLLPYSRSMARARDRSRARSLSGSERDLPLSTLRDFAILGYSLAYWLFGISDICGWQPNLH
jgi:hypothetical protein